MKLQYIKKVLAARKLVVKEVRMTPHKRMDPAKIEQYYSNGGSVPGTTHGKADFDFDEAFMDGDELVFKNVSTDKSDLIQNTDDVENEFKEEVYWAIDSIKESFAK